MISFSDIDKLPFSLKAVIIGFIFIMPFWFLAMYLFSSVFFGNNPLYISIIVVFCISCGWYFGLFSMGVIIQKWIWPGINDEMPAYGVLLIAIVLSMVNLSVLTYIGWINKFGFLKFLNIEAIIMASEFFLVMVMPNKWMTRKQK